MMLTVGSCVGKELSSCHWRQLKNPKVPQHRCQRWDSELVQVEPADAGSPLGLRVNDRLTSTPSSQPPKSPGTSGPGSAHCGKGKANSHILTFGHYPLPQDGLRTR